MEIAVKAVAFDCFGTVVRMTNSRNSWKPIVEQTIRLRGRPGLDARCALHLTIEDYAASCGVRFDRKWRVDLDHDIASIEVMPGARETMLSLKSSGFKIALASNLATEYVDPVMSLVGDLADVTVFSCDPRIRLAKPDQFFSTPWRGGWDCGTAMS